MMTNEDWILKEIRGVSQTIGTVLRLKQNNIDLGTIIDKEGREISGRRYLNQLLSDKKFIEAKKFVKSKCKSLNYTEYSILVGYFMSYLRNLDKKILYDFKLDDFTLDNWESELYAFEW